MALTGRDADPPLLAAAPVATAARGVIAALAGVASSSAVLDATPLLALDAPALLGERAAVACAAMPATRPAQYAFVTPGIATG